MSHIRCLSILKSIALRNEIRHLLGNRFSLTTAFDLTEGLALAIDHIPHVVIIDDAFPERALSDMIRKFRSIPAMRDIPILLLISEKTSLQDLTALAKAVTAMFFKNVLTLVLSTYIKNYFTDTGQESGNPQIAILDRSVFMGKMLNTLLDSYDINCHIFRSADRCFQFINRQDVDLILVSIHPPNAGGLELIQRIRAVKTLDSTPIIVMNSVESRVGNVESFTLGANDYITKPFQRDEVILRIRAHLKSARLQKDLKFKNERLVALNDLKDEFIGMAAHDLRSPLATIITTIDFLMENLDTDPEDYNRLLGIMRSTGNKMINMLNELLIINRIESGKLSIMTRPIKLPDFIQLVEDMNRHLAVKKQITLCFDNTLDGVMIRIDDDKILQVLSNLISNAVKYSAPDTRVTVTFTSVETNTLRCEVADQGLGIPEREQHLVFEPFSRISVRPTQGETKTGLGLAICKKTIQAHNGRIGFRSVQGKGSVFFFELDSVIL